MLLTITVCILGVMIVSIVCIIWKGVGCDS